MINLFLALSGFWLVVVAIIAFIIIIGVIITVHELGHLFFAKRAGILCHEFSIGMGPVIYKHQFKETTFTIRAIPIGGYVAMAGEENLTDIVKFNDQIGLNLENDKVKEIILDEKVESQITGNVFEYDFEGKGENKLHISLRTETGNNYYEIADDAFFVFSKNKRYQIEPYDRSFDSKSKWKRFITLFAGAMNNFILAILIYIIISFATGVPNYDSNVIGEVTYSETMEYPAYKAGLQKDDKIIEVNGNKIDTWTDFQKELENIFKENNTTIPLKVLRGTEEKSFNIEAYTYIVSIGLSNMGSSTYGLKNITVDNKQISGLEVGACNVRYINTPSNKIKTGDILTGISVTYDEKDKENPQNIDFENKEITSWSQLITIFKDIKSASKIKFQYYSKNTDDTYTLVDYEASGIAEPYTDEVLNNQRIEKIQQKIGVAPTTHFSFFGCIGNAFAQFGNDFTLIFRTLKLLIAPSGVRQVGVQNLSSFVGIFSMVESYINSGFLSLLGLTAMLSVNIGVVNLLPIPALDGGRILFLIIEAITRKKPSKKVENIINNIFFVLILALFVVVTVFDIMRIINK